MAEIFVVDDSVSVRKALEIALKPHGIHTRNAVSGEDALEKLDEAPFDLMITDIIMPGINGFELCQQVKANPKYAHIPVLLISGNVDEEVKREAHQVGAEDILRKPFRPDELLPVVQRFLALSAERQASAAPAASAPAAPAASSETAPAAPSLGQAVATAFYDAEGHLVQSGGVALPENMLSYARFYLNTAHALSQQLGSGQIADIHMNFQDQTVVFSEMDGRVKIEVYLKN